MTPQRLQAEIGKPGANLAALSRRIARDQKLLPELFIGLGAEPARTKFGCLKVLRLISETHPAVLYPFFEQVAALLKHSNRILNWGGRIIIGNLAAVDTANRLDGLLDSFLKPVAGPEMITAANTIGAAAKIAQAKPRLARKIVNALLKVESAQYETAECRNVALGRVVKAFEQIFELVPNRNDVLEFIRRQTTNSRNAVSQKAKRFLKRCERQNLAAQRKRAG